MDLVSVSANSATIEDYYFISAGSATTIKGYFVDLNGDKVGLAASLTIPAIGVDPVGFVIPEGAVGLIGDLAADVKYMTVKDEKQMAFSTTSHLADLKGNSGNFPTLKAGTSLSFGKVAVV